MSAKKKTILIIDDEPHIQTMVATRLQANDFKVITALDGKEGLEKVKKERPDLILLDIMMPEMDGYDFLRELKKISGVNLMPIIMFTAKVRREDIDKAIYLGAVDYVIKPFTSTVLLDKIRQFLKS
ncbi:MAG: response regulator [Candidatus Omnitrophica bacterium]|nr:response regulator [Candidatus Omnitrophota bacterium]MDD5671724.1 response regulator [Candidatus Omnitrophota bacterium]